MKTVFAILFGAGFAVAVMYSLGLLLLQVLKLDFHKQERRVFAFLSGAACLSFLMFAVLTAQVARRGVFLAVGIAAVALAVRFGRGVSRDPLPPLNRVWAVLFWCIFGLFTCAYFFYALAPEVSPDGSSYHLGVIYRYLRAHGFYRITTNMYANLSQGAELLYMFAFAFGRHSAAALVHLSFLVVLALSMTFYARRFGFEGAGVTGALLAYLAPIVGFDAASAYIDLAVAAVLFGIFYLLQIWDEERRPGLLILIGLLAGFAYAMKYTAFLALPYALGFVAWKSWRKTGRLLRPAALVAGCAFVMIAPWIIRNAVWYGNPFSPFYNAWFPNPYIHIGLEQDYRFQLAHWNGVTNWLEIARQVTLRGDKLQGLIGPVFILAPIALLALRWKQGRQLLLAAGLFLATYPANIGTRFLIPALPFLSLAMGMVLVNWRLMAPLVVVAHAYASWPENLNTFCSPYAMRIFHEIPVEAALRIEPEEKYFARRLPGYFVARMIEEKVPPQSKVLSYSGWPESYMSRELLNSYQAALNNNLCDMMWGAKNADWQPTRRLTFKFPLRTLRRVRVVQTAGKSTDRWSISEFRVLSGARELAREPQWRLLANPNPWEVQAAFDNNPMTRWRSWQAISPGQFVQVDFGRAEQIDSVALVTTPDQWAARFRLEGQGQTGPWQPLAGEPEASTIPAPANLREMIVRELRWTGIEYLLLRDDDYIADDVRAHRREWRLNEVAQKNGAHLYKID